MAYYSEAAEVTQVGDEVTPGVLVAANKQDPYMKIMMDIAGAENQLLTPSGGMFPGGGIPGMVWGEGSYEAPFTFGGLHRILNSVFYKVTAAASGTGGVVKTRVYAPPLRAVSPYQTYSFEVGQTGAVLRYVYGVLNSMKFKLNKEGGAPVTGDVLARFNDIGTALTASPTEPNLTVVPDIAWNCYTAATFATLTSAPTQVTTMWDADFNYGPVRSSAAMINSATDSWDALGVGEAPSNSLMLTTPKDVSGTDFAGILTRAKQRANSKIFMRFSALGALLDTGVYETIIIDLCLRLHGEAKKAGVGPFAGLQWPLKIVGDNVSGKAIQITTISDIAD